MIATIPANVIIYFRLNDLKQPVAKKEKTIEQLPEHNIKKVEQQKVLVLRSQQDFHKLGRHVGKANETANP